MAITIPNVGLYLNPSSGLLDSSYDPNQTGYSHGDEIVVTGLTTASLTLDEAAESVTITDAVTVGGTLANTGSWYFNNGAVNPTIQLDALYGKYMFNNYGNMTQLDATKSYTLASSVGLGKDLYFTRITKARVTTTGGGNYSGSWQWKGFRIISNNGIVDTADNTESQLAALNSSFGRQFRVESGEGIISGNATATSSTQVLTDSTKSWGVNTLTGRYLSIDSGAGAGQGGLILSNTATTVTCQYAFSTPINTSSVYSINAGVFYGTDNDMNINEDWAREEFFLTTNTSNTANAELVKIVRDASGARTVINKTNFSYYNSALRWTHVNFQDYLGSYSGAVTGQENFTGDILIQVGSDTRLVLTNNLDVNAADVYIPQYATSWTGNQATIPYLNTHGVAVSGDYYLCEVSGLNTVLSSRVYSIIAFGA